MATKEYRIWRALVDCHGKITGRGHVVGARRGETFPCPPELEMLARQYAIPVDEEGADSPDPVPHDLGDNVREARIIEALKVIIVRNDPDEFSQSTGMPKQQVVAKEASMRVKADEVRQLFLRIKDEVVLPPVASDPE